MKRTARFSLSALTALSAVVSPLASQVPRDVTVQPVPSVAPTAPAVYAARRARVMQRLGGGVALMLGSTPVTRDLPFAQDNNFHYLTGVDAPNAVLVLDGRTRESRLYLPMRSPAQQAWEGPELIPGDSAARVTGLSAVLDRRQLLADLDARLKAGDTLWMPAGAPEPMPASGGDATPVWNATRRDSLLAWDSYHGTARAQMAARFPDAKLADLTPVLNRQRWIKDAVEIAHLRRASALAVEGLLEAVRSTVPGRREHELATAAEVASRLRGAEGLAFPSILASGPNVNIIHHTKLTRRISERDLILLDYGVRDGGYMSDITRTWPSSGTFTAEQRYIYESLTMARDSILAAIRPGVRPSDLLAISRRVLRARGDTTGFWMNYLGHPVGMSTHDPNGGPNAAWEPGVVFNIEPIFDDPRRGWHFRIEDTILVTESGYENLTAGAPTDIDALIRLRAQPGLYESVVRPH
jgi:Xaa-Pro aminopeptidase